MRRNQMHGLIAAGILGLMTVTATSRAQVVAWFGDVTPNAQFADYIRHIAVHPIDGRRVIAVGSRIYLSRDGGASWTEPSARLFLGGAVDRIYAHKGWPGMVYLQVPHFASLFGTPRPGALLRSNDFGEHWEEVDGRLGDETLTLSPFASDPLAPEHILAALALPLSCGIGCAWRDIPWQKSLAESRDGGRTWRAISEFPGSFYAGIVDGPTPAAPSRLLATAESGYRVSQDGGHSWEARATTPPMRMAWIRQDPVEANILYASAEILTTTGGAGIVRSDDNGASWRMIYPLVRGSSFTAYRAGDLTIDPVRSRRLWLSKIEDGLHLSENRGESWLYVGFRAEYFSQGIDSSTIPGAVFASAADSPQGYMLRNGRVFRLELQPRPRIAIEYRYGDRYWLTADPGEAISQDHRANDAVRTGRRFGLWSPADVPAGAAGICRFQGNPAHGQSSRFIAVDGPECEIVKGLPDFLLEGQGEYYAMPPAAQGGCAEGLVPVHRFNNLQANVNHRYVADPATVAEMRAAGWYDEGVRMCARPLGPEEMQ